MGLNFLSFDSVTEFIHSLPTDEQLKIGAAIDSMKERDFDSVYVKTLKGPIKELIVKSRRFIFCIENNTIYFLRAFTKKSAKTPKREIKMAERMYKLLLKQLQTNK